MKGKLSVIGVLPLLCIGAVLICSGQSRAPIRVVANGIEFHYIEKGQGEPLILLHGGIGDYRSWDQQIDSFAAKYRVISYSRRYNYPNKNEYNDRYKGALTDADDLAAFIGKLGLKKVHLVGLSYGALTALILAVKNPDVALSLVLAEPPAHQLIRDTSEGEVLYSRFLAESKPVAEAFRAGDDRLAINLFNRKMGRDFEKLSPPVAEMMLQNALALKAINFADEPFPAISKAKLRRLKTPTLILTGEKTIEIHRAVDVELARLLPNATSMIVPNAGHSIPRDNPEFFNSTVIGFLSTKSIAADKRIDIMTQTKNTICLWYDKDAQAAAEFYAATFPDSGVTAVHKAPGDFPGGKEGQALTVEFTVCGVPCIGLNGGPAFKHNEAFSFQIATKDQEETDRYWNAIVGNGGEASMCGWCKDKWGLSWQITPAALIEGWTDPDPAVAKRVFDAMMTMKKIDVASIEAARLLDRKDK